MAEISNAIDLSWVQCNKCMKKMNKYEGLRYGLTNCGHIYCENCLKNATQPKCFVCQAPSPRAIELNQHLRPELRRQFLAVVPVSQVWFFRIWSLNDWIPTIELLSYFCIRFEQI